MRVPTLGHVVGLGELFDQRSGSFLSVHLCLQGKVQGSEVEVDLRHTEITLSKVASFEDKAQLLDINPEVSLSVLSGLVQPAELYSYIMDAKVNTNEPAFALALKMKTTERRLLFPETDLGQNILDVAREDYIDTHRATHFVYSIAYGGCFIVNLIPKQPTVSNGEKLGGMEAEITALKGAINLQRTVDWETRINFMHLNDKFDLTVHGAVLQSVPINPQDVPRAFASAGQHIVGVGGFPISVTLQPIPQTRKRSFRAVNLVYPLDAALTDKLFKDFASLRDIGNRFSVLKERVGSLRCFVPELDHAISIVARGFAAEHDEHIHELQTFLCNYRQGRGPSPKSPFGTEGENGDVCSMGEKVLKVVEDLHNRHLYPTQKGRCGRYSASLVGLENEYSRFRSLISGIQRVRESLNSSMSLNNIDDIVEAASIQNKFMLFIMTPLIPASDNSSSGNIAPDIALIQFHAILRDYAAHFKDSALSNAIYILYAENLEQLEHRLPNNGRFSGLKAPSLFIGEVSARGRLIWADPSSLSDPDTA